MLRVQPHGVVEIGNVVSHVMDGLAVMGVVALPAPLLSIPIEISPSVGCGGNLGLVYAVSPMLSRYSMGLREPREILIRFSLYQRM